VSPPRNALDEMFERSRTEGRATLVPYVTGGFPRPSEYVDLAVAVLEAGADALEIGIPFSDPLLDGPSIQRSQQIALEAGVTPAHCLEYARDIHAQTQKPLLFMGAYNPVLAYGLTKFCAASAEAGVSALIIPDLPFEEQGELRVAADAAGLHVIQLVAPTSTPERLRRACEVATGFIYCISVSGVTGAHRNIAPTAQPLVERVRRLTDVPVAVGFGIANPDTAREVATFADGVIVGSALIDVIAQAGDAGRAGAEFVRLLAEATSQKANRSQQLAE
jgi:tryptophan synthase alpha chain